VWNRRMMGRIIVAAPASLDVSAFVWIPAQRDKNVCPAGLTAYRAKRKIP